MENGVCSSESVNGGEDVWSCNKSDASSADHLVVMVHGILGRSNIHAQKLHMLIQMIICMNKFSI